jgi:hypothetical protein
MDGQSVGLYPKFHRLSPFPHHTKLSHPQLEKKSIENYK